MKNLAIRTLSGLVYIAVFVGCILLGETWFFCLTEVLALLGVVEFLRLTMSNWGSHKALPFAFFTILAALSLTALTYNWIDCPQWCLILNLILFIVSVFALLATAVFTNWHETLRDTMSGVFAVIYIALPLMLLNGIYALPGPGNGSTLILVSLIGIWINDTGAFCVGCSIGKHRLCERLSPKKSWEGFWGGLALVVVAFIIYAIVQNYNVLLYAVYGAVISILATLGDLFESLIKRTAGVKDSGRLIPGHGGILDRIDSFLFVAYGIWLMSLCLYN